MRHLGFKPKPNCAGLGTLTAIPMRQHFSKYTRDDKNYYYYYYIKYIKKEINYQNNLDSKAENLKQIKAQKQE